jgi:putative ABC transport system permease protein
MSRLRLIGRLAARDARRHPAQSVLLIVVITASMAILAVGLMLHGLTNQPYQQTRTATAGPDIVLSILNGPAPDAAQRVAPAELRHALHVYGVAGHDGPYPVSWPVLGLHGLKAGVIAEGRDLAAAPIDQPKLTAGTWVRPGGVVVERTFADALSLHVGDALTLNHRSFRVDGIAVTAADNPYPNAAFATFGGPFAHPGLVWLTRAAARSLATHNFPLSYIEYLRLSNPVEAPAFETTHASTDLRALGISSWQDIEKNDGRLITNEQLVLLVGSWLLALLAIASVAVVVAGRLADQTRRVGILKALGATPRLIAVVLLAEHLVLALVGAAAGLALGWLAAPLLGATGAALIGTARAPTISAGDIAIVIAVALLVPLAATLVPAIRSARTSTVDALSDSSRRPKRRTTLIAISRRLPVTMLLGLRLIARRPRRALLSATSVLITTTTLVAAITVKAHQLQQLNPGLSSLPDPRITAINEVLGAITAVLVVLAAINAIFIATTTATDARQTLAIARALGATRNQISAGIIAAGLLAALPASILGIPAGIALVHAVGHGTRQTTPPALWLVGAVAGTLIAIAALTLIPARLSARRPIASILQAELA